MRQIYLIPNLITAFGLACGLFVIFKVNMVEPGWGTYEMLHNAALFLLVAAFADLIDGAVARVIGAESEFGLAFDSLADAISFGVAPSVLLLKRLSLEQGTGLSLFAVVGALIYSVCGVLRLARFNVKSAVVKGDREALIAHQKNFTGLPIPAAAIAAVSANFLLASPFGEKFFPMSDTVKAVLLTSFMVILGFFMISRWKFPSIKTLHFRVPSSQLVFFTVAIATCVLYGILYFFPIILSVVSWGYILLGCLLSIIRLIAGKKSKTLEDFEPEPEE